MSVKELYANEYGNVSQCDKTRSLLVNFNGMTNHYKITCFFALKANLDAIDVDKMALCSDTSSDVAIVSPCSCERVYVLDLIQLVAFKDLLAGAKVMLELNSILRECLSPALLV